MRKIKILAALSAIALVPSCSKNGTPGYLSDPDAVRFETVVGALTKSNPVGTPEEQKVFNEGDRIGISNGGDFVTYILENGSWVPADASEYLKWESGSMTFRAYYPANNASSFEIGDVYTAQSEESVLKYSDYMTAETTSDKAQAGKRLTLNMNRRTARVVVKIDSFRDEFDGTNPVVSGVKVYSPLKVPYTEPYDPSPIESFSRDGVFYALVSPGEARPDQTFLELTVEYGESKQTKTLAVKGVPAMEAGKSYTCSVIVGKTSVKVGSVSVRDWTTGEPVDDGLTESMVSWSGKTEPFALTDSEGNALGGSENSPILIENAEQLAYLAEQVNAGNTYYEKYFKLTSDINLSRKPWTPIGNSNKTFSGNFDGGGKKIYGLKVNANADYAGLFGSSGSGIIKNVRIESADVAPGKKFMAAVLCGYSSGTIQGCSVRGSVEALTYVGGIVGMLVRGKVTDCAAEVTVKATGGYVGGICGVMGSNSTVSYCDVVDSHVEGGDDSYVGGVVGRLDNNEKGKVLNCSVNGTLKGTTGTNVGGIIGAIAFSTPEVSECFVYADIYAAGKHVGGLFGTIYNGSTSSPGSKISTCGFDGSIITEGSGDYGAVVGEDLTPTTFTDCWYNADKTGDLPAVAKVYDQTKDYSGITAKNLGK